MRFNPIAKKVAALFSLSILGSFLAANNAQADASESYLQQIAQNTKGVLDKVDKFPEYVADMLKYTTQMLKDDDSDDTLLMQSKFSSLAAAFTDPTIQNDVKLQQRLAADMVNAPVAALTTPEGSPDILKTMPNINSLMYSSMIGVKPVPSNKAQFDPYSYLKSAAGLDLMHITPPAETDRSWRGAPGNITRYRGYYNTILATESFSSYILSNTYADAIGGDGSTSAMQKQLITQASDIKWLTIVNTEEIGRVLRHILMYQSQNYVLMTQLLQTQKQLLTATVMTNSLLIASNQTNETIMVSKATGQPLG